MRKVLLVGSVGYEEAETVFNRLAETIAACTPRFTDGEIPPRNRWMMWQRDVFDRSPSFELDSAEEVLLGGEQVLLEKFRIREGQKHQSVQVGELGYAREAVKSFAVFSRLRDQGIIPPGIRFQMSLPSAVAVCSVLIAPRDQALVESWYEAALEREVAEMLEHIPASDFAVQWDICQEVLAIEGAWQVCYEDLTTGAIERLHRLSAMVPEPCELGFHLCYGDPGHKHIKEPENLAVCVALANGVCKGNSRSVNWIHMPVPRDRNDDEYFVPLRDLDLASATELYLGLVHLSDGIAGAQRRIETAQCHIPDFGIATECGFGRRPLETIPDLLQLHAEVAAL